jgi:hypothetical protein
MLTDVECLSASSLALMAARMVGYVARETVDPVVTVTVYMALLP